MDKVTDLRSDTVTPSSPKMQEVIVTAPVKGDQRGGDHTINRLQDRIASFLRKEAIRWIPTGTMAN